MKNPVPIARVRPIVAIPARLKRLRARLGLTQARLASILGISAPTVNRWENGHSQPSPPVWRRVEEIEREAESRPAGTRERVALRPATSPSNLPIPLADFVGRGRELAEGRRLLQSTRVLTLTGPGGCGKTRLALELAWQAALDVPDGVFFVELAALADPGLVPQAVASALHVGDDAHHSVSAALDEKFRSARALLVLDNCEHLADACAQLVEGLLARCPRLQVLATSRESLGVTGETNWTVPPLSVPGPSDPRTPEHLLAFDAVRLFVERVQAANPSFELTAGNAAAVAEICVRLEGLPLALELAAARARVLTVHEMVPLLDDQYRLMGSGRRTAARRHQSMRATLDWSYGLLSPAEQTLLRRLAVFSGSFTLDAAEAVGAGSLVERGEVLDLIHHLADKSLVSGLVGAESTRYRLLETVRQFGRERLGERGETEEVERRQAEWCRRLAERAGAELHGPRQAAWLDRLEVENDNLRLALRFFENRGDAEAWLSTAASLYRFWTIRGYLQEGFATLSRALERRDGVPIAVLIAALRGASVIARELSNRPVASLWTIEHRQLCEEGGDARGTGWALANLAIVDWGDRAPDLLDRAAALFEAENDRLGVGWSLGYHGLIPLDSAERYHWFEQSLDCLRGVGDLFGISWACGHSAVCLTRLGNTREAAARLQEAIELATVLGARYLLATHLETLGRLLEGDEGERLSVGRGAEPMASLSQLGWSTLSDLLASQIRSERSGSLLDALQNHAFELRRSSGDTLGMAVSLVVVGVRCAVQGDLERAVRLLACGTSFFTSRNASVFFGWNDVEPKYEHAIKIARLRVGEARFQELWQIGAATPLAEAAGWASEAVDGPIADANGLDQIGQAPLSVAPTPTPSPPARGDSPLTNRECDVLRLVAQGRSNGEIGRELVLSVRTVEHHLANVYAKTGTRRRTAAVALAIQRGIL